MNRVKIAAAILIFSIILGLCSLFYITETCEVLIEHLNKTINFTLTENADSAKNELILIVEKYEKCKPIFNVFLGQGETLEIRNDLNKAIFFINTADKSSAILHLEECKTDLNRIIIYNTPSISTIL